MRCEPAPGWIELDKVDVNSATAGNGVVEDGLVSAPGDRAPLAVVARTAEM